jgi:RNA polymerase sigma factor (sigma-70 family)
MPQFSTTHWSVVLIAGQENEGGEQALQKICERYWYPLYAFTRRSGYDSHSAADATQGFFLYLLDSSLLSKADPKRGRFRTFLLESLKHYLISEHRSAQAIKRGGGQLILSLDEKLAESRFALEPKDHRTPERLFERSWALNLLDQTLSILRSDYRKTGRGELFQALEKAILKDADVDTYQRIARELNMNEGSIKVAVHRLRSRFREILRGLVASTVGDLEVEDELRHLQKILRNGT